MIEWIENPVNPLLTVIAVQTDVGYYEIRWPRGSDEYRLFYFGHNIEGAGIFMRFDTAMIIKTSPLVDELKEYVNEHYVLMKMQGVYEDPRS